MRKAFSVLVLAVIGIMVFPVTNVNALLINVENQFLSSVFDSFSSMRIPDPNKNWDYWWRTLRSATPANGRTENVDCAGGVNNDSNCVFAMSEGWNDFARFRLRPSNNNSPFYLAQITDIRDSDQTKPMRWKAEPGKPVIVTTRVRFSENYNLDGTGGAHGTTGIGFWNNPTEFHDTPPFLTVKPIKAIQYTYSEAGNPAGFVGYNAGMTDQSTGNFFPQLQRVTNFNMQEWTTQSIVWSIDSNGLDNAKFYVNGEKVAEFTAPQPLPAMTFLAWVDCTFIDFAAGGIVCSGPDEEQFMDMDFVSIVQPG